MVVDNFRLYTCIRDRNEFEFNVFHGILANLWAYSALLLSRYA